MAEPTGNAGTGDPPDDLALPPATGPGPEPEQGSSSVRWLADYVYGTISTLVAIAGLDYANTPNALVAAGVVVVGSVAIWFAHALSRIVTMPSWQRLMLRPTDVTDQLKGSWSIATAAIPATLIFVLAALDVWKVKTAFTLAEVVGVLALAVVATGTTGGRGLSAWRRTLYVLGLVSVGVLIVLFELLVHLL